MISKRRSFFLAALLLTLVFTSGCWDRKEIENRGYVMGAAIDFILPEPKEKYDLEGAFQQVGRRKYRLSYEVRKAKSVSPGERSGTSEENLVYSAEGESLFAATRAMASRSRWGMFLEDVQVVLVSEAVAREGIKEVFDFFARDPEMRRRARIFITQGRAEEYIKRKPRTGEINSLGYARLVVNAQKTPTIGGASEFGYIAKSLHSEQGFAVPMLYLEGEEVKAAGAALFNRQGRMVGISSEYEAYGGKLWRNILKQGVVAVPNPENPEDIVVVEMFEIKTRVKPDLSGEAVRFSLEGDIIVNLGESVPFQDKPFSDKCLQDIEQAVAAELTSQSFAVLAKSQEIRADTFGLGAAIRRKKPQYWNQVKDRWEEEVFPTVEADVKLNVKIRGTGMIY